MKEEYIKLLSNIQRWNARSTQTIHSWQSVTIRHHRLWVVYICIQQHPGPPGMAIRWSRNKCSLVTYNCPFWFVHDVLPCYIRDICEGTEISLLSPGSSRVIHVRTNFFWKNTGIYRLHTEFVPRSCTGLKRSRNMIFHGHPYQHGFLHEKTMHKPLRFMQSDDWFACNHKNTHAMVRIGTTKIGRWVVLSSDLKVLGFNLTMHFSLHIHSTPMSLN